MVDDFFTPIQDGDEFFTPIATPSMNDKDSVLRAIEQIVGNQAGAQQIASSFTRKFGDLYGEGSENVPKKAMERVGTESGVYGAGRMVVGGAIGLAKAVSENLKHTLQTAGRAMPHLPGLRLAYKQVSAAEQWSDQWANNLEWYDKAHPEDTQVTNKQGFTAITKDLIGNPHKMFKGAIISLPLMLEGMLPGGTAVMASSLAGEHYLQNRREGDDPQQAIMRAVATSVPEAAIERFTLGKKIDLFHNMPNHLRRGTGKAVWEMVKAYARGVGEEGSQQFNENMWRWLLSDRTTDLFQGVLDQAAVGGPLEAFTSGAFASAGVVAASTGDTTVDTQHKLNRLERIRNVVTNGVADPDAVIEINKTIAGIADDIKSGKFNQPMTNEQSIGEKYGLTPEHTADTLSRADTRFNELDALNSKHGLTDNELAEYLFLRDNRTSISSLVDISTDPRTKITYLEDVTIQGPVKSNTSFTRQRYKNLVANLTDRLAQQEMQGGKDEKTAKTTVQALLDDVIYQVAGKKKSLKSLSSKQLTDVASLLGDFTPGGIIPQSDWDNQVMLDGERVRVRDIMENADQGADRHDIVKPVSTNTISSKLTTALGKIRDVTVGVVNTPFYHIAHVLDAGDNNGVFSKLHRTLQKGRESAAVFNRMVVTKFQQAMEDFGIDANEATRMSTSLDGVRGIIGRAITSRIPGLSSGKTQQYTVAVGDGQYKMTMGQLIYTYLISNQQQGRKHLLTGGLVVNGINTGGLTPAQLADLRSLVDGDEKAKAIADTIVDISDNDWSVAINTVSISQDGKKIAVVPHWFGFDVQRPTDLAGQKREFAVNLVEDKSIFNPRTNSELPLHVHDAFDAFSVFQSAIADYVGLSEPLRIARTVFNSTELWDKYKQHGMETMWEAAKDRLRVAQGEVHRKNFVTALASKVMPRVYGALLYFNPMVWGSQYTSILNYGSVASVKYMKDALTSLPKSIKDPVLWDEMLQSPIAWDRFYASSATMELGAAAQTDVARRTVLGKSGWYNKAAWTLKAADLGALLGGWQIARAEFADAQSGSIAGESARWWAGKEVLGLEEGSPERMTLIQERAHDLWLNTQPSWDKLGRTGVSGLPTLARTFFPFRSFHEKVLTMWNSAYADLKYSDKSASDVGRFANRVSWPIASYAANTLMRAALAYGLYGKAKERKEILEDLILAPLQTMPIVGPILDRLIRAFDNGVEKKGIYLNDDTLESLPLTFIEQSIDASEGIAYGMGLMAGDQEKADAAIEKALTNLVSNLGLTLGVPVYTIKNIANRGKDNETEDGKQKENIKYE